LAEGLQSRESLPEIVVDHERPGVDSSTEDASETPGVVVDDDDQWQTTLTHQMSDVQSPNNDYDYLLHRLHHHRPAPPATLAAAAAARVSSVVVSRPHRSTTYVHARAE